jgi:hypothetical protein
MARPKLDIDGDLVEKMASWGAKNIEIAAHFKCSEQTITERFQDNLRKGRSDLKMSLRQWQLASARNGNVVMLIWLGKQMLGQQERTELVLSKIPDEMLIEEAKKRLANGSGEG